MNAFNKIHPTVLFVYFVSVLVITMFSMFPVILVIALSGGMIFCKIFESKSEFIKGLIFYIILFIVISVTNPIFSHNGVTTLFFINGNAITLEAIIYGINMAIMLIAVMYWFKCFNYIMTSDKLLFIFGRLSKKTALILSSALRFIPLLKYQWKKINQAGKTMGLYSSGNWTDNIKGRIREFSALATWSFENAIDTGTSMKARGYELKGRSYFSVFKFKYSDGVLMTIIAILDLIIFSMMIKGKIEFEFYPVISPININMEMLILFTAFGIMCYLPAIIEIKENIKWKYYKSKI